MAKRLTNEAILDMLGDVWEEGYVFLPRIPGDCTDSKQRKRSYEEGPAFSWPEDRDKMLAYMDKYVDDDVYWCPATFERPRRLENYAMPESWLWADLDEANPRELDIKPTIAWESSPSLGDEPPHWQGLWRLDREVLGASWAGAENHKLTSSIDGADPSGWDTTQLLRLPGWPNHKPERRQANRGRAPIGRVLWTDGPTYDPETFKILPDVEGASHLAEVMDFELDLVDRHSVWARVRMKLSSDVRQIINARDTEGADRSEVLWRIERDLADCGLSPIEIAALIRGTVWNKYSGRNDETRRLVTEAAKAVAAKSDSLEVEDLERRADPMTAAQVFANVRRPQWLVDQIWQKGSCGFISGPPKHYKSYFTLDLMVSLAAGLPFLNKYRIEQPVPTLYICEEDPLPLLRQRYDEVISGKDRRLHYQGYFALDSDGLSWHPPIREIPLYIYAGQGFKASDPAWQHWLDETIDRLGLQMVTIDTLGTAAGDVDLDKYADVNEAVLAPLKDIAHRNDCALGLVHHNSKSAQELGGRAMLGSVGFHGWVEEAMYFGGKSDAGDMRTGVKVLRESKLDRDLSIDVTVPYITRDDGWLPIIDERSDEDDIRARPINAAKRPSSTPRIVRLIQGAGGSLTTEEIMDMGVMNRAQALRSARQAEDQGTLHRTSGGVWSIVT